ncbi:uracil-DNA glycosylase [Natronolimnohabitans innermongolicus]|uniref:Type-4 uracil-DNA glycosylase n=1 Tax=Natronolimnohabitans innermongolicus JCM 12255 TaxID=1227499 RepID=L9X1W2_9EURY|nr:uracil-DNA glycosylase [Natronolimnohabitans innermongolicus]ELY55764.1 phage SPO1 DNA polymerase-related protein [Natronolimnohabitans innermongolicus JCM 12255]
MGDSNGADTDVESTGWRFESEFADALEGVPVDQYDPERFVGGVGPLSADAMLVGEAPGKQEVTQGEPFVGQAGQQLDRALESIGHDRRDLYVTNLVKVRPPENRDPRVAEIEAWWPVFEAEIECVDPSVIVPMGSFATGELLETDETITDVRGESFECEVLRTSSSSNSSSGAGTDPRAQTVRTVRPAFHPAAALYDRSKVDAIESDLRAALEEA